MTKIVIRILAFGLGLIALTLFNWPDLPVEGINVTLYVFSWIKYLDMYVPFQLFLNYALAIVTIELSIKVLTIYDEIKSALTGTHSMFGVFTGKRTAYRGEDE